METSSRLGLLLPGIPAVVSLPSALTVIALGVLVYSLTSHRRHPPVPPGPKGLPILGNVRDIPLEREWHTYTDWAKEYGPIVSVHILGQRVVLLNTPDLARELFESRSSLYSDRPFAPMLNMMGYGQWLVGLLQPGQQWTMCRKLLTQCFNPQAALKWRSYSQQEVNRLLGKLLDDPEDFYRHVDRAVVGNYMMVLYGHRVPVSGEDDFVAMHDKSLRETSKAIASGAYLVNLFPSFRHIPQWMVGAGFQREAKEAFGTGQQVFHGPMEMVKKEMKKGEENRSYISALLEEGEDEFAIKQTAATAYNAGVTGSKSALLTSILVMTLFPEARRKAQQEIDSVTGGSRLPEYKDRDLLPYTEAFMKEIFRWSPPAPVGLPRVVTKDDVIRGYFIPAGTVLMSNMWAILHDETRYEKPYEFIPERHLDRNGRCSDPTLEGFGFGKRICPGRHLVDSLAWLAVASVLAAFDVRKPVDADGKEVSPPVDYSPGLFSAPKPFKASIRPRSKALAELIRKSRP